MKTKRYFTRTVEHIHRVQKNMLYLVTECTDFKAQSLFDLSDADTRRQLMWNVMNHDRSKFSMTQSTPYIELTEYYHQRKKLGNTNYQYPSKEIEEAVEFAVQDHYKVENHHPEKHSLVIAELVEVVCDLQAMAQEFGEGSCRKYFEEVWCKKQQKNFYDPNLDHPDAYAVRSKQQPLISWEVAKDFMSKLIEEFEKSELAS